MTLARRALPFLLLACSLPLAGACGTDQPAAPLDRPDAGGVIIPPVDAGPADAEPVPDAVVVPDARPADLSCADDPPPTDAVPATIHISGLVTTITGTMQAPVADATVEAHARNDDATAVATGTTSALGTFSVDITTGGVAFDGYVSIKKDGLMPIYLFFADPLRADSTGSQMLTIPMAQLTQLAGLAGITVQAGDGFMLLRLEDCQHFGVENAHVVIEGGDTDTQVMDLGVGPLAQMFAGAGAVINVPVVEGVGTPVTIKVTVGTGALQDDPVKVFPDSLTYSILHP